MSKVGISRWDKQVITDELYLIWENATENMLKNIDKYEAKEYKIPPISHSVYFTRNLEPVKLKDLYIKKSSICINKLNEVDANFKHYIWTNNPNIYIGKLESYSNIQIKLITELSNHTLYNNVEDLLKREDLKIINLVQASDVARIMAVQTFGGIYHDLDYEIFDGNLMIKYMKSFNYFNGREFDFHDSFIGNAFFASSKNHPIMIEMTNLILRNLNRPDEAPKYIQFPESPSDAIFVETGPVAMTIATYKGMNKNNNIDIIFPAAVLYNAKKVNPDIQLSVSNEFKDMLIKTVGADMFSGGWNEKEALNSIKEHHTNELGYSESIENKAQYPEIIKDIFLFYREIWKYVDFGYIQIKNMLFGNYESRNLQAIKTNIDKIYVLNLAQSYETWEKISTSLDKLNIPHERFNAINGINIKLIDQATGVEFKGIELKHDMSLLKYNSDYTVFCSPSDHKGITFNFMHIETPYKYSVDDLGETCSYLAISSEIVKNKYKNAMVLKDNIEIYPNNFHTKLLNYVVNLPSTFDIAYLSISSNSSEQITVNKYVNKFPSEANFHGSKGVIQSYKGAEKLLLTQQYFGSLENHIMLTSENVKISNTGESSLEVYISRELQYSIIETLNNLDDIQIHTYNP
jgi:hypothetical protein